MTTTASWSEAAAPAADVTPDETLRLSHHAWIRAGEDGLVLETPFGVRGYPVSSPAVVRLLLALARPSRVSDLLASLDEERQRPLLRLLTELRLAGVLTTVIAEGGSAEAHSTAARWEPHDLFFHTRSRRGRNPRLVGASYPLRGVLPPEPYLAAPRGTADVLPLPVPDMARVEREDPPLSRVLEARRSRYSLAPVTLAALGELLYRSFRVTHTLPIEGGERVARKVYPSAGSCHPLELYVVPWTCEGLDRKVYHYRSAEHTLAPLCDFGDEAELLLEEARRATGRIEGYPPVLLVLSARILRVSWKYQALAYSAILKEVGCVFQTLYLVATAMGLSPCGLGAGDSDRFARVTGIDYYGETSVGEFILGGPAGASPHGGEKDHASGVDP